MAALAEYCDGHLLLYATSAAPLAEHRAAGGRALAILRGGRGRCPLLMHPLDLAILLAYLLLVTVIALVVMRR